MPAVAKVQESCRIYLVVPSRADADLEVRLQEILASGAVSCVLLGCEPDGLVDRALAGRLRANLHSFDIAFLVESDIAAAAALGADGVHIAGDPERYAAARHALGANAIVGADCGISRHCAMELGEQGADYVALGSGRDSSGTETEALISWWAELFEVPCVAWNVADADAAVGLARSGADFVALAHVLWEQAGALADLAAALAEPRTAA